VIVIQGTELDAVHAHPAPAVTAIALPGPPAASIACELGAMVGLHGVGVGVGVGVPVGVGVGVGVPVGVGEAVGEGVGVPVGVGVGLGDTLGVGDAVGEGVGVDGGGAGRASCATSNARPAIVKTLLREAVPFESTLNVTRPGPVPDWPAVIVSHDAVAAALHAQSLAVRIATCAVPPSAPNDCVRGAMSYWHGVPSCRTWTG
jgi:hypothetical protein